MLVNTDLTRTDQSAYLQAAEALKSSNYTALTDRNRMPVYPFLLSLLYQPGLSEEAFFARGKLLNVGLSLLILPILFWIFRRYLPLFTAVNLLLIHAFTLYMFKAPFVQAELLFYLLSFVAYLLMCRLLWRPVGERVWQTAVFTGIVLGVAHLTKASVLPGLVLYVVTAVWQAAWGWVGKRPWQRPNRQFWQQMANPALVVLLFLITVWPYIQNSRQQFGHYFYNVNSTFYLWYDSWDEVEAGTKDHDDRVGWPTIPIEEIPTAAKYFREHTPGQIFTRFLDGLLVILIVTTFSYGYAIYFWLLVGFAFVLMWRNRQTLWQKLKPHLFLTIFIGSYFISYGLLYAWYWPISSGNRFVLALFSPAMFTLAFFLYRLLPGHLMLKNREKGSKPLNFGPLLNWTYLAILLVDGCIILTVRISTMYGGA
ncbi:MAG: hypothetical protein KC433_19520 [Anaerolineales bacterium]|nr:hypothetical protein [Anaerolineales bacterium]